MNKDKITLLLIATLLTGLTIASVGATTNPDVTKEVTTHVTVLPKSIISISINSTELDFGNITAGEYNMANIYISNEGNVNITVNVNPSDMKAAKGAIIKRDNFKLFPESPLLIPTGYGVVVESVNLTVPNDVQAGDYYGTIDITAGEVNTQHF